MPAADVLVSVAIPAYNARATLAQTHRQLDIIVVDDGSTDRTWALLQRYGPLVRAIRQTNAGTGAARHTSMQAARGDFIVLLDADDICEPDRIAIQLAYLLAHPDILLCSTDFSSFDDHRELQASSIASYYHRCSPALGGVRARYTNESTFELVQTMRARADRSVSRCTEARSKSRSPKATLSIQEWRCFGARFWPRPVAFAPRCASLVNGNGSFAWRVRDRALI